MELTTAMIASITVVVVVVFFQIKKFIQNRKRINLFSKIFEGQDYDLKKDEHGMVVGITGTGNQIFNQISGSINGYLRGTQGTQVDFQLLKDSVDRHCDMIEDEINSQMPLPLYFGLAGTMTGAIIGLFALLSDGTINQLMSGDASNPMTSGAANSINDLLWGVAIAMSASAVGIILTSYNTIYFKDKKLQEETQKNKFLAWVQSRVLSAVPSSVSQQMKALVGQLATFNRNFRSNTDAVNETLKRAREVYQSQADVIEEYKAIDLEAIANGVNSIMRRLKNSTESLDNFTEYLTVVHEYYKEMQVFAEKLDKETERIGILQDIQRFFHAHKGVIAEETADAQKDLQKSLKAVQDATEQQINNTYAVLTEQSQKLRDAVDENNVQFRKLCNDMRNKFQEQMESMPSVAQNLKNLEDIPNRLNTAVNKLTQSQEHLASEFIAATQKIINAAGKGTQKQTDGVIKIEQESAPLQIPASIKWTVIVGIVLMTLATIGNTAYNIWKGETKEAPIVITEQPEQTTSTDNSITTPSIYIIPDTATAD